MINGRDNAASVLKLIAQARLSALPSILPPAPELEAAVKSSFADLTPGAATEAELAQAALDVLVEDPEFREPVRIMQAQPATASDKYIDASGIAVITAAILVLQTRVKAKKDSTGKWSIEMEKKDLNSGALKSLIERLLPFLGK